MESFGCASALDLAAAAERAGNQVGVSRRPTGMRTRTVRRGIRTFAVLAALSLAATACTDDAGRPAASGGGGDVVGLRGAAPMLLQSERSCDAVLEDFQAFAPAVLEDRFFGFRDVDVTMEAAPDTATAGAMDGAAAPSPDDASRGGTSDTNTQEAGIDEPDVVETDGELVYLVDQQELIVLDGDTAQVLSRTPLASWGTRLLLQGDRLLAIAGGGVGGPVPMPMPLEDTAVDPAVSGPVEAPGAGPVPAVPEREPIPIEPEPLPGPVEPPDFHAGTVLQLLDVSDPTAPAVVQTTEIEGNHVATRVVDGVARVVVTSYPDAQPLHDGVAIAMERGGDPGRAAELLAAEVADTTIADWLPAYRATTVDGDGASTSEQGQLVACEDVFVPEVNAGIAETSVLRVDFTDGFDPADTTTVVAEAGTVYASSATLYLAANRYVPVDDRGRIVDEEHTTALHAFDLRGHGAAPHLGGGEIPGHVLDQYSLSEHDGYLRVATTEGAPWGGGEDRHSGVRVLRLDGSRLVEVGAVTGLGVTETIQSVRFMGPVGYVVTFRQTDPLYVIDLSDPTAPRAVGELKIPGFSSYLHPAGEGRLVGIGRDADLEGRDRGLLVSLFDVRDPTAPTQVHTWTERDAWSQAGDDPKAFLHWAPESAVIVPIERYGPQRAQAGMLVLDVGDRGITERATVTADGRYPSRALVVQGRLWSLFDGGVMVTDFANPAQGTFTGFR